MSIDHGGDNSQKALELKKAQDNFDVAVHENPETVGQALAENPFAEMVLKTWQSLAFDVIMRDVIPPTESSPSVPPKDYYIPDHKGPASPWATTTNEGTTYVGPHSNTNAHIHNNWWITNIWVIKE